MNDMNGKITYSDVLKVSNSKNVTVSVYPNPAIKGGSVNIISSTRILGWQLFNVSGQVILQGNQTSGSLAVKMPDAAGTYFMKVSTIAGDNTYQLVVQ
jgi:hypothetical protein